MSAKIGPTKLFRNRISGDRFLAAEKPDGDVHYTQLDENNNPINAGNQFPKEEYNKLLDNSEIELDKILPLLHFSMENLLKKGEIRPSLDII